MIILGIETSCDETSAALLKIERGKFEVLAHVVSSSVKLQAKYGGIVPEVAARKQLEYIIPVLSEALKTGNPKLKILNPKQIQKNKTQKSNLLEFRVSNLEFVTAIAVTAGPGLATSLQVGIDTAKTLAYAWQKPIIPTNHLEGHLLSPLLMKKESRNSKFKTLNKFKIQFPAIGLIVSGGHTELILIKDYLKYKPLGQTRDDAAGEAFDKVAKLLGLGYPGGPIISKLAKSGDAVKYDFPRGMISSGDYDFSFSGLKTAVLYKTRELGSKETKNQINNLCASFQQAAVDVLVAKTMKAVKEYKAKMLLVGGGVSANPLLRKELEKNCQLNSINLQLSPVKYTGDNAAMIALAGYFRYKAGDYIRSNPQTKAWQEIKVQPNLKLV